MQELSKYTDEQIPDLFRQHRNKNAVLEEVMRRYKHRVYYHVRRMLNSHEDADDAAQLTFVKIWQNLETFRGDSKFYSWVYRIATNEALNILRKNKKWDGAEDVSEESVMQESDLEIPDGEWILGKLQDAVSKLPTKQQLVFNLKWQEEFTYEDIADITGTSVGALKASYFHAVKKIQTELGKHV